MTYHSNVMLRRLQASIVCVYEILRFCANPQKFQTLVPQEIVTLRYVADDTEHPQ